MSEDHSIEAYLKRQNAEKLAAYLDTLLQKDTLTAYDAYIIRLIQNLLPYEDR